MDTEKVVEKMFENFVVEKQKNLENKMHFGSMDRWKNKQCRSAKFLLWGFHFQLKLFLAFSLANLPLQLLRLESLQWRALDYVHEATRP